MHATIPLFTFLLVYCQNWVSALPTWPASTDELEDILFLTTGYRARGFALPVTPCSKGLSDSRITGAEWIRAAFHDSISGNIYTGVGGLDGSIAFEFGNSENKGVFARDAVFSWAPYVSDLTSLSDIIAAATYAATRSCSDISVSVRGGRVDATAAGPFGFIPQPQNALGTFRNQFARMGLGDQGMVQFVACGHSIGGVHAADHPDITDNSFATFDTTPATIDNTLAIQYISNTTQDPLVIGKSVTSRRNSDFVVFSQTDRNATIRALAHDPDLFASACKDLFETMIDLVPTGVELSDPITPYEVKPYALQLTLLDGGSKIRFTGDIRVRTSQREVSQVQLLYTDRNGATASTTISTSLKGTAAGFDDSFSFFGFSAELSTDASISSFVVEVTSDDSTLVFDNNGPGFVVGDSIIYQAPQSCLDTSGEMTVVAAVRSDQDAPNLKVMVKVPQASPNPVPSISTATAAMASQSAVGSYQLYSATFTFSDSQASSALFGVFGANDADVRKSPSGLPVTCTPLAASTLSPSSVLTPTSSTSSQSASAFSNSTQMPTPNSASISTSSSASSSSIITPTPAASFEFEGCSSDYSHPRALSAKATHDDEMTVEKCAATCSLYQYFGLEYANECYCGNTLDPTSTEKPLSDCNMPCSGNSSQMCGAGNHISLYRNLQYSPPINPQIDGYDYKGCYSEGNISRALTGPSLHRDDMSVEMCALFCGGATYFGTEYSRECFCGSTLESGSVPQPATECNRPCSGNSTEYCGGSNRLNLYQKTSITRRTISNSG